MVEFSVLIGLHDAGIGLTLHKQDYFASSTLHPVFPFKEESLLN
jgi:hypothetical protein